MFGFKPLSSTPVSSSVSSGGNTAQGGWDSGVWDAALWDSLQITGNTATGGVGGISLSKTAVLTGVSGTGQAGNVSPNLTLAISGVTGTGTVGNVVYTPEIVLIDTHDPGDKKQKRFKQEVDEKKKRKEQLIAIYEDLLEAKPSIVEQIVAPVAKTGNFDIYDSIDFDALLSDLNRVEALYREHQEMDDEEVLLLL